MSKWQSIKQTTGDNMPYTQENPFKTCYRYRFAKIKNKVGVTSGSHSTKDESIGQVDLSKAIE